MSDLNKDNILINGKERYNSLLYRASRLSRQIEELDIDETKIKKEDIKYITEMPTLNNTEFGIIYSFEDKLYKKVSGEYTDKVMCYTDIFMELVDINNELTQLARVLSENKVNEAEK